MNIAEDYELRENGFKCPICGRTLNGVVIDLKLVAYECPNCPAFGGISEPIYLKPNKNK